MSLSSAHSMNARKCDHAQKPYSSQEFAHESNRAGGKGKREEKEKERQRLMERKSAKPNKNLPEELKKSYLGSR